MLGHAGDAERRRPHVGAAAVAAEVEGHADDVNGCVMSHDVSASAVRSSRCPRTRPTRCSSTACGCVWMAARKSRHLALLVDHVVGKEQSARSDPRERPGRRTSCSRASRRPGTRRRRCPSSLGISVNASPGMTWTMSARDRRAWMLAAASFARTGSYSMVTSRPPVSRSARPIQMAAVAAGSADFEDRAWRWSRPPASSGTGRPLRIPRVGPCRRPGSSRRSLSAGAGCHARGPGCLGRLNDEVGHGEQEGRQKGKNAQNHPAILSRGVRDCAGPAAAHAIVSPFIGNPGGIVSPIYTRPIREQAGARPRHPSVAGPL